MSTQHQTRLSSATVQRSFATNSGSFGSGISTHVLDDAKLKSLVQPEVWGEFLRTRDGIPMKKASRNTLARAVREWAESKGCATYALWFSPVRGPLHGEKLETFMGVDFTTGELIASLSGTELFQTETDGSSFPNGGLRATHRAAAYIAWDTSSSPFIYRDTLYIPSAFVSWAGEALDNKIPLLRSSSAVSKQALRLLGHLESPASKVITNVGWEQEFFIVDRDVYLQRPDLVNTGRALIGQPVLRGQLQSINYFAKMPLRVRQFMQDVRRRMWEVGISIKCMHNEVAPAQQEVSPIFSITNHAADTNVLAMEILRDTSYEHGLYVLFHEKPFKGLNGSGKHLNWGLNTDTGDNLYSLGNSARERRNFVAFTAALVRAVKQHGDLLRVGIATPGNDHRLGAHEAPPAILTLYLGESLEQQFRQIASGQLKIKDFAPVLSRELPVAGSVPTVTTTSEDRNRTAPIPWCGNRFEFRACGGNQQISFPLTMLHAAVADSLEYMADRMDRGEAPDAVIQDTLAKNQGVLFSGNGYDTKLLEEIVEREKLFNLRTSPESYKQFVAEKNVDLLSKHAIFAKHEVLARQELLLEAYAMDIQIETRVLLHMLRTGVAPAVARVEAAERISDELRSASGALYSRRNEAFKALLKQIDELDAAVEGFPSSSDVHKQADYALNVLKPLLSSARATSDKLEGLLDQREWPYPSLDRVLQFH
jgi:glutamine synthetase